MLAREAANHTMATSTYDVDRHVRTLLTNHPAIDSKHQHFIWQRWSAQRLNRHYALTANAALPTRKVAKIAEKNRVPQAPAVV